MIATTKISMDLANAALQPVIDVMQDDKYTRDIQITLHSGGKKLELSQVTGVLIRYSKPDGTYGVYDTMPDGSCAWSIEEAAVTVRLAPQTCTTPGKVLLNISLLQSEAQLSVFALCLQVRPLPQGRVCSENYINTNVYIPQPDSAAAGQYLMIRQVSSDGKVTEVDAVEPPYAGARWRGEWQLSELYSNNDCVRFQDGLYFRSGGSADNVHTNQPNRDPCWQLMLRGGVYTLPVATPQVLGGVRPVLATDSMTQPVGVTTAGRLATAPAKGVSYEAQQLTQEQKDQARTNIEAAPAGFGLGESGVGTVTNPDDITVNGLYCVDTVSVENGNVFQNPLLRHTQCNTQVAVQELIGMEHFQTDGCGNVVCRRQKNGAWQPWEWVDPPLLPGIEYRTTERYSGKVVYCKLVDCGMCPAASEKTVETGATGTGIVRHHGTFGERTLPWNYNSSYGISLPSVGVTNITVKSTYDWSSAYHIYVTIYYTKD